MLTLIAVLTGTALGGAITLLAETLRSRRTEAAGVKTDRRRVYSTFLSSVSQHANAITQYHTARVGNYPDAPDLWRRVCEKHDEGLSPFFELRLLAGERLVAAADGIRLHIYQYQERARNAPLDDQDFDSDWSLEWPLFAEEVVAAARAELGMDLLPFELFAVVETGREASSAPKSIA